jgi:hypothetical protein
MRSECNTTPEGKRQTSEPRGKVNGGAAVVNRLDDPRPPSGFAMKIQQGSAPLHSGAIVGKDCLPAAAVIVDPVLIGIAGRCGSYAGLANGIRHLPKKVDTGWFVNQIQDVAALIDENIRYEVRSFESTRLEGTANGDVSDRRSGKFGFHNPETADKPPSTTIRWPVM